MGWTQESLAQTVFAPVETIREWESGARLIPPKVIAFVSLYARQGEVGADMVAGTRHAPDAIGGAEAAVALQASEARPLDLIAAP